MRCLLLPCSRYVLSVSSSFCWYWRFSRTKLMVSIPRRNSIILQMFHYGLHSTSQVTFLSKSSCIQCLKDCVHIQTSRNEKLKNLNFVFTKSNKLRLLVEYHLNNYYKGLMVGTGIYFSVVLPVGRNRNTRRNLPVWRGANKPPRLTTSWIEPRSH